MLRTYKRSRVGACMSATREHFRGRSPRTARRSLLWKAKGAEGRLGCGLGAFNNKPPDAGQRPSAFLLETPRGARGRKGCRLGAFKNKPPDAGRRPKKARVRSGWGVGGGGCWRMRTSVASAEDSTQGLFGWCLDWLGEEWIVE